MTADGSPHGGGGGQEPVGEPVQCATQQLSQLVRDEMSLAALGNKQIGRASPPTPERNGC